jgi:hypothetical protein
MLPTHSQRPRYVSGTEQAKMIRAALKTSFPGVKFSVRQGGGSSVDVEWTDGPTGAAVDAVCQLYRGGGFDGMQDLRYSVQTVLTTDKGAELVQFAHDFVFTRRNFSDEFVGRMLSLFEFVLDRPLPRDRREWHNVLVPLAVGREGELHHMVERETDYLSDIVHRFASHQDAATMLTVSDG